MTETRNKTETNEVDNEQENENENENDEEENEEDPLPDGDLENQEIGLQPAHRAEALDVFTSIELKFTTLRERVYAEKMEILFGKNQWFKHVSCVHFVPRNLCNLSQPCTQKCKE